MTNPNSTLHTKYATERTKRQAASKGLSQFLNRAQSSAFITADPWIATGTPAPRPVPDGGSVKLLVFGAGFAGVLAAVKALETGAVEGAGEVCVVEAAGGWGGTWYWNRYPGLMCDVESYTYLPMLEETGYVPSRRFAGGEEIRGYVELLARRYGLEGRAMFQAAGRKIAWEGDRWACEIVQHPKGGAEETVRIYADYVVLASGGFTYPKMPDVQGLGEFRGEMLHTGRWDYGITGGTPAEPRMERLRGKRVAVVGTGATAIQAVPELAKWAGELYVFQRTPSAVDYRGNRDTTEEEWRGKIATKKGWQEERLRELQVFTEQTDGLPEGKEEELGGDGFASMPSISGTFGGPSDVKPEDAAEHLAKLHAIDDARSDKVRARTMEIVDDPETAKKLQAWYPGWCKRPTFHDEYLPTFNRPNVHLVDTDGKGVEAVTPNGIKVDGHEYPIDVIVWSTGYGNPLTESLAGKAEMAVRGKNGEDMEQLNQQMALKTLHGCMSSGFPNLFLTALSQAGVGVNQVQRLEEQSLHNGYIIAEAQRRVDGGKKPIIEPTEEACEKWGDELASAAHLTAGILACTPGYFTLEGDAASIPQEALAKMARTGIYGQGYMKYAKTLESWRKQGDMLGLEIAAA